MFGILLRKDHLKKMNHTTEDLRRPAASHSLDSINIVVREGHALAAPTGCRFLKDECTEQPLGQFIVERVALHSENDAIVPGEELLDLEQAINLRIGPNGAAAFLDQQDKIPVSWRGKALIATGCVVDSERSPGTCRMVAYLWWFGGLWVLCRGGLDRGYDCTYHHQVLRIRRAL